MEGVLFISCYLDDDYNKMEYKMQIEELLTSLVEKGYLVIRNEGMIGIDIREIMGRWPQDLP
jgi:hypothetical protein